MVIARTFLIVALLLGAGEARATRLLFDLNDDFGGSATLSLPDTGIVSFPSEGTFGGSSILILDGVGSVEFQVFEIVLNPIFGQGSAYSRVQLIIGIAPFQPPLIGSLSPGGLLTVPQGPYGVTIVLRCESQPACNAFGATPGVTFFIDEIQSLTLPDFQLELGGPGPGTMTALQPFDFSIGPVAGSIMLKGQLIPEPALSFMLLVGLLVAVPATRLRLND